MAAQGAAAGVEHSSGEVTGTIQPLPARPGAIGLVPVRGLGGEGIKLGELILDGLCAVQHAFILLEDGTVVGAEPHGPTVVPLADYDGTEIFWIDREMSPFARDRVLAHARPRAGEGYNWWAYVWLGCEKFHFHPDWVKRRVDDPRNAMCSQRVDRVYQMARADCVNPTDLTALTLFNDGRDPGDVTPGDLYPLHTHSSGG